ncbi:glutaredoxin family protein [Paenarthrobacter sp. Z7-10]|uniref:glutaredoxin family protein n=1 Tax=Paenarthrobacter sp. Z7-10 TaxID=2787635 RepID=UPI0022A96B26|nr:glutaredoxin family protein [Paenarthrobacter sp. Z7-10]MCZ2401774.1 glutaredoxin family protein [Paenarthrobacter sp. Z7-10]
MPSNPATPELTLITKANCHLCTAARDVVVGVAAELGLAWNEKSIDHEPALAARFAEEIPVVLVDGVQRDFWTIDPDRLRRILRQAMDGGTGAP